MADSDRHKEPRIKTTGLNDQASSVLFEVRRVGTSGRVEQRLNRANDKEGRTRKWRTNRAGRLVLLCKQLDATESQESTNYKSSK
jgi:hypothetical protein